MSDQFQVGDVVQGPEMTIDHIGKFEGTKKGALHLVR
jgi:hypothetical protein